MSNKVRRTFTIGTKLQGRSMGTDGQFTHSLILRFDATVLPILREPFQTRMAAGLVEVRTSKQRWPTEDID